MGAPKGAAHRFAGTRRAQRSTPESVAAGRYTPNPPRANRSLTIGALAPMSQTENVRTQTTRVAMTPSRFSLTNDSGEFRVNSAVVRQSKRSDGLSHVQGVSTAWNHCGTTRWSGGDARVVARLMWEEWEDGGTWRPSRT